MRLILGWGFERVALIGYLLRGVGGFLMLSLMLGSCRSQILVLGSLRIRIFNTIDGRWPLL